MLKDIKILNIYYGEGDIVNSIFVYNSKTLLVIDTAVTGEKQKLLDQIDKYDFNKLYVVLTHAHPDHIGNNAEISRRFNPIFIANLNAQNLLEDYKTQIFKLRDKTEKEINLPEEIKKFWLSLMDGEVKIDITFDSQLDLRIGNRRINLVHLPGHAYEEIGIIDKNNRLLILGELIFDHKRPMLIFIDDYDDYISSLKRVEQIIKIEDIQSLVTSHVPEIVNGQDRILEIVKSNMEYINSMKAKADQIFEATGSIEDTAKKLCEKYDKPFSFFSIYTVKAMIK